VRGVSAGLFKNMRRAKSPTSAMEDAAGIGFPYDIGKP
jgi:hypothetical protein